jgi:hypothetical protein
MQDLANFSSVPGAALLGVLLSALFGVLFGSLFGLLFGELFGCCSEVPAREAAMGRRYRRYRRTVTPAIRARGSACAMSDHYLSALGRKWEGPGAWRRARGHLYLNLTTGTSTI